MHAPSWIVDYFAIAMSTLTVVVLGIIGVLAAKAHQNAPHTAQVGQSPKSRPEKMVVPRQKQIPTYLWVLLAICVSLTLVFQMVAAMEHHAYDTESIKYYDEKFDKMQHARMLAATVLMEVHKSGNWNTPTNQTDSLDDVLGFFDQLGYDEQHGKISADVAWEYFYDDIADYYQGSVEYIAISQKDDPTWFDNIKPLYNDVAKVQAAKTHRQLTELHISDEDYLDYLRSEINLSKTQ